MDRLKAGPADIAGILNSDERHVDTSFTGNDTLYWPGFTDYDAYYWYYELDFSDWYFYDRWANVFPEIGLFDADGTVDWTEAVQGGLGTCYIKAAMGSLAEFPDLVRGAFVNPEKNDQGIYGVKFYIRGKPWVVTVDDEMLFYKSYEFEGEEYPVSLVFAQPSVDGNSIWGAVLEKAWAKVKGNYLHAEAGLMTNGIRALTGVPVFEYWAEEITGRDAMNEAFERLAAAEAAGYIMAATTAGDGDDSVANECGIAKSHAYSIISAFTMTDAAGEEHQCLLIRNPWAENGYSFRWSANDPRWT